MIPSRRAVIGGLGASVALPAAAGAVPQGRALSLTLNGAWRQGGYAFGRTTPGAMILVDGEALTVASSSGLFVVGFDRDAGPRAEIEARTGAGSARQALDIAPYAFPSTRIDGLPPATVEPSDPALLDRIRQEAALKAEGFASRAETDDFRDGFIWPLETYRVSSAWGAQRVLNGTPARPHYGIDLAAPAGTTIRAPADGRVAFVRPNMHFEGGLTLIDHGQGLITAYLHQSRLDVLLGQTVQRGQALGQVGMTGRATGPHLCWRMKWRDRNMDPSLMVGVQAPRGPI
ncbi:M23 family metallopeptidase [Brevundimonas sp. SORGH_AS_0993]|uniref:M23 family metallopeptidase n=1 Tax=Brevundimonas sp. SORGH_AS_0993 TaxID=3041794 RepID=UPI002786E069|nr:M23 family metallopeptidase [Brevundimonas sp. SORGH_AS_0993]MDQ1155612.1 murein DD-endopeptidase MepM/ murein hydrolase activator NlpD [Brevundimonas sp. SORGH_AS_0993]